MPQAAPEGEDIPEIRRIDKAIIFGREQQNIPADFSAVYVVVFFNIDNPLSKTKIRMNYDQAADAFSCTIPQLVENRRYPCELVIIINGRKEGRTVIRRELEVSTYRQRGLRRTSTATGGVPPAQPGTPPAAPGERPAERPAEGGAVAPETPSPSPTASLAEVRQRISSHATQILENVQNPELITDIKGIFEQFEVDVEGMGITGDIRALVLTAFVDAIRIRDGVAPQVKAQFPQNRPVASFEDLEARLRRGVHDTTQGYRIAVLQRLCAKKEARDFFGALPGRYNQTNPLGNRSEWNAIFEQVCGVHDLGHLLGPTGSSSEIETALSSVANVPARSRELLQEREQILKGWAARVTPEQRRRLEGVIRDMPRQTLGKGLDTGLQVGGSLVLASSVGIPAAIIGLVGKSGLEVLFGAKFRDLIAAGKRDVRDRRAFGSLGSQMLHNNVLARLFGRRGIYNRSARRWDEFKQICWDWLKGAVPTAPYWHRLNDDDDDVSSPSQGQVSGRDRARQLITEAAQAAMREQPAAAR